MRFWPISLVVFGAALLATQLWPLWTDVVRLALVVEVLALGITAVLAAQEGKHV